MTRSRKAATAGREMPYREDGQVYGKVTHMLGNGRVTADCDDGMTRLCRIRGSMRRREWVRLGDTVLVALRSFQDEKADVIFRYDDNEVRRLLSMGEITRDQHADEDEDADVVFSNEEDWNAI
ncbi:Eukaryotic translation initiation factor 1A [Chlorella vulgaris]